MKKKLPYCALLFVIVLLGCREHKNKSISVIKFEKVKRMPNSLEYNDAPFTIEEKKAAVAYFKKYDRFFLTDADGNIYLRQNDYYGEGIKHYFWIVTDEIEDSANRARIYIPDSLLYNESDFK